MIKDLQMKKSARDKKKADGDNDGPDSDEFDESKIPSAEAIMKENKRQERLARKKAREDITPIDYVIQMLKWLLGIIGLIYMFKVRIMKK